MTAIIGGAFIVAVICQETLDVDLAVLGQLTISFLSQREGLMNFGIT
jgi:hypothetical protein